MTSPLLSSSPSAFDPNFRVSRSSTLWLAVAVIGFLWWTLINHLRVEWSVNAQYAYGVAVPFLTAYLFWLRWADSDSFLRRDPVPKPNKWILFTLMFLAFLLLPIGLVEEANPEWRLISWALAMVVVGMTLLLILRSFGSVALRHFAFPICFFLVSVPWPTALENFTIQGLTRGNIFSTLELLGLAGIPALQQGNLIEISRGVVGVDEACSGIRSLQATLMLSLFFGELFRLTPLRRLALCGIGFGLAFIFNIARTFLLVWIASRDGIAAINKWHDPAGVSILLGCFVGLWIAARVLRLKKSNAEKAAAFPATFLARTLSKQKWTMISLLIWFGFVLCATELWYRWHESKLPRNAQWSVQWPETNRAFKDVPISESARRMLRFNEGRNAIWSDVEGRRWQMFYARWNPGATTVHLAKSHTPEICLAALGRKIQFTSELRTMEAGGLQLPYRVYVYDVRGQPVHVFYSLWEDRAVEQGFKTELLTLDNRLTPVLEGRRNRGQRSLLTAVWGAETVESAEAAWHQQLDQVLRKTEIPSL